MASDANSPVPAHEEELIIAPSEIDIQKSSPLGGTRGGSVFKAIRSHALVAVKVLAAEVQQEALVDRCGVWRKLHHPNVHVVFGVSPAEVDPPFMVTECHLNGNVRQFLTRNPNSDRCAVVLQTALGMQYLHKCGIVHGSLKPSNILMKSDGAVCVSDYGMIELQPSKSPDAHRYFSPEAWKGTTSGPSDVFAFAMSALEIFTSNPPWGVLPEKHIYQLVMYDDTRPDRPDIQLSTRVGLSDSIWEIVEEAWHKEARLRPSFDIIVRLWQAAFPADGPGIQASSRGSSVSTFRGRPDLKTSHASNLSSSSSGGPPAYEPMAGSSQKDVSPNVIPLPQSAMTDVFPTTPPPMSPRRPIRNLTHPPPISPSISGSSAGSSNRPASPLPITPQSARMFDPSIRTRTSMNSMNSESIPRRQSQFTTKFPKPVDEERSVSSFTTDMRSTLPPSSPPPISSSASARDESIRQWEAEQRQLTAHSQPLSPDLLSIRSGITSRGAPSVIASSPMLLVGALQAEVADGRNNYAINEYIAKIQFIASESDKDAQKLITAGAVPTLIHLLKTRAATSEGLEIVLIALGFLAHDPISANTIYRTNTTGTLIEILRAAGTAELMTLAVWTLSRIARGPEISAGLIKSGLIRLLIQKGLHGDRATPGLSAYCIGNLAHTDALAEALAEIGVIPALAALLKSATESLHVEEICGATYALARLSRSIKLAKAIGKVGCVPILARNLSQAHDPHVLHWTCRAIGCLMRPSSSDMSKMLLDAGVARGLARLPGVIPSEEVEPLASFAFAIQRFSCAEWGSGTRKALVEAGVVDSLLAALRTASDEPCPQVHIELALAVSFLGDVGGSPIRKEIVQAGGIEILKRVGAAGTAEVSKACTTAVVSITGNLFTRNAASAKTAMSHNWNGGCPEYQPMCPLILAEEEGFVP